MYREGRNGATLGPPGGLRSGPEHRACQVLGGPGHGPRPAQQQLAFGHARQVSDPHDGRVRPGPRGRRVLPRGKPRLRRRRRTSPASSIECGPATGTNESAHVKSRNNFPTASGLASSASGFAALAGAASRAAWPFSHPEGTLPARPARVGGVLPGRSSVGSSSGGPGFGPTDVTATPHPSRGRAIGRAVDHVALVRGAPVKSIRSAVAMQSTVATSPKYARRLEEVPGRIALLKKAIRTRDAETLFATTIEECDSFRAVCESTTPRLDYLTATSRAILDSVRTANAEAGRPIAAYTHDAGAHVHVFTLSRDLPRLRRRARTGSWGSRVGSPCGPAPSGDPSVAGSSASGASRGCTARSARFRPSLRERVELEDDAVRIDPARREIAPTELRVLLGPEERIESSRERASSRARTSSDDGSRKARCSAMTSSSTEGGWRWMRGLALLRSQSVIVPSV